jgi:hypothetical protein
MLSATSIHTKKKSIKKETRELLPTRYNTTRYNKAETRQDAKGKGYVTGLFRGKRESKQERGAARKDSVSRPRGSERSIQMELPSCLESKKGTCRQRVVMIARELI